MYKTIFLSGVAAAAIIASGSSPVSAADLYVAPTPVPVVFAPQVAHDWSGLYFGADLGYGKANFDGIQNNGSSSYAVADDLDLSGATAGIHVGYNWQRDSLVFGIEGDLMFMDWNDYDRQFESPTEGGIAGDVDLLASVRGRVGLAFDQYTPGMVYLTGGIAFASADYEVTQSSGSWEHSFNDVGGVIGAGFEIALSDRTSVRAEGLYYMFDERVDTSDISGLEDSDGDFAEFENAFVARIGVSVKLGGLIGGS